MREIGPNGFRRIAVIADDLSGALASAASLADHFGERVPVLDGVPDPVPPRVVINSHARAEGVRGQWLEQTVRALWESGTRLFDKRIDSTLRGPTAAELQILVESLPLLPWVIAVPAYPGAGRVTRGGQQWHRRVLVGRVADAIGADDLSRRLGGVLVETAPRGGDSLVQADNPGPYVVDVRHRSDLQVVAHAIRALSATSSRPLVLVSSGDLLRYLPESPPRPVAVVWGSGSAENARQLRQLSRVSDAALASIWDPPDPSLSAMIRVLVSHAVVRPPGPETDAAVSHRVLQHLHVWADHGFRPARIIISGGDTAQAVLRASGARSLQALRSPAPLVGMGLIQGGSLHGLELMTKGGKVGSPDLLADLVELFWRTPYDPWEE
ncbi:MAG: four-carbon acid sugar kinase family protein [Clostridia bacterium]